MKKVVRKLHLWLSVPFGIIITLICFSGAMLVFEKEVTEWSRPELYYVESIGETRLSIGEAAARVASTLPAGVQVTGITVYPDPQRTYQVNLSKPKRAAVFVNPYTGELLGQYERLPFFRSMFSLHRWLLGSRPSDGGIFWGKMVVGVSTLLFVFVLISGLVIWWPRTGKALRNGLKVVLHRGWLRFWHGLHVAGGMYVLLLLLVMALTGLTWSFSWYRTGFYALFGVEMQVGKGHASSSAHSKSRQVGKGEKGEPADYSQWQQVYEQLAVLNPSYKQITVSAAHTATVSLNRLGNTRGADTYTFDSRTGSIIKKVSYSEQPASGKMRGWIYALHVGSWGGCLTRILYFLAALLGASLPLTGYYLWIRRLVKKRIYS